jgi:hypothetical protein
VRFNPAGEMSPREIIEGNPSSKGGDI